MQKHKYMENKKSINKKHFSSIIKGFRLSQTLECTFKIQLLLELYNPGLKIYSKVAHLKKIDEFGF